MGVPVSPGSACGPEGIESEDRAEEITLSQNDNHVKKKKSEEWKVQRHYTKHA